MEGAEQIPVYSDHDFLTQQGARCKKQKGVVSNVHLGQVRASRWAQLGEDSQESDYQPVIPVCVE